MKFTKEIKDNWLANLKSGKYIQGFGSLESDETIEGKLFHTFCCIGVLGDCTPGLENKIFYKDDNDPYNFLEKNIGGSETNKLYTLNDSIDWENRKSLKIRDYSNVIPLIESLPTVD